MMSKQRAPARVHLCPDDGAEARLIVDLTQKRHRPIIDASGHFQYYCLTCHRRFVVNNAGQVVALEGSHGNEGENAATSRSLDGR